MSAQDVNRKDYIASSVLLIVLAASMALLVLKTPTTPIRYLFFATPYVFLFSIWWKFHNVFKKTELSEDASDEGKMARTQYLYSAIQMQTLFGAIGIAVALAMGFLLGRLGSH